MPMETHTEELMEPMVAKGEGVGTPSVHTLVFFGLKFLMTQEDKKRFWLKVKSRMRCIPVHPNLAHLSIAARDNGL